MSVARLKVLSMVSRLSLRMTDSAMSLLKVLNFRFRAFLVGNKVFYQLGIHYNY